MLFHNEASSSFHVSASLDFIFLELKRLLRQKTPLPERTCPWSATTLTTRQSPRSLCRLFGDYKDLRCFCLSGFSAYSCLKGEKGGRSTDAPKLYRDCWTDDSRPSIVKSWRHAPRGVGSAALQMKHLYLKFHLVRDQGVGRIDKAVSRQVWPCHKQS